jgi:polyketide cyclase/dehydrase/lipid transport protein
VKPVTVSIDVPNSPHEVYDFLDVLGNHEKFMDHFLVDWQLSGPPRGVGSKANVAVRVRGEKDRTDFEVLEADAGRRILEESRGGPGGRRHLRGTYHLTERPGGGTRIEFELEFLELPRRERLMGPLNRAYIRRINRKGLKRLAEQLSAQTG